MALERSANKPDLHLNDRELPSAHTDLVLYVNMWDGMANTSLVRGLLASNKVLAMVILLPPDTNAPAYADGLALVDMAATLGLHDYIGGFDGPPYTRAASKALSGAIFMSTSRLEPPKVHIFAPLFVPHPNLLPDLKRLLCFYLLDTASTCNIALHVIGPNQAGDVIGGVKGGKIHILLKAFQLHSVGPSDLVVMIDSMDALAQLPADSQLPADTIVRRYFESGAPIFLSGTETNCWPPDFAPWCHRYDEISPPQGYPNKYLNGGGFMGRAVIITQYLTDLLDVFTGSVKRTSWYPQACTKNQDDQHLLACPYVHGNPYGLSLDLRGDVYFCLHESSHRLVKSGNKFIYNLSSVAPVFLHGNGEGKEHLTRLRNELVPNNRTNPAYTFLLDGVPTRHGDFCTAV